VIIIIFKSIFYLKINQNNIFFIFKIYFWFLLVSWNWNFITRVCFKFKWTSFQYFGEFFWLLIVFYLIFLFICFLILYYISFNFVKGIYMNKMISPFTKHCTISFSLAVLGTESSTQDTWNLCFCFGAMFQNQRSGVALMVVRSIRFMPRWLDECWLYEISTISWTLLAPRLSQSFMFWDCSRKIFSMSEYLGVPF
jgi:hypothetical protein